MKDGKLKTDNGNLPVSILGNACVGGLLVCKKDIEFVILKLLYGQWEKLNYSLNYSGCLQGQGHVTVNKPAISRIYIVVHTLPLCSVQSLVERVNQH